MSGDYSRDRFYPGKSFSRVRQQQGRVGLDADWNEAWDIQDRRWRAETLDLMGRCAVSPQTPEAFKIEPSGDGSTFMIGLGRMYVDGLLAENFGSGAQTFDPVLAEARPSDPVLYTNQPYLPDESPLPAGRYLVYLDVWEREVTHIEDPDLLEPALRGVDTTTRMKTLWQVRSLPIEADASAGCRASLDEVAPTSTGRLSVSFDDSLVKDDPCVLPPTGGYRGAENHLYRIQIHAGGGLAEVAGEEEDTGAIFKWSRDNASTVIAVRSVAGSKVSLESLGRDRNSGIAKGDWVEILDDHRELRGESGDLAKVIEINEGAQEITLDRDLPIAGNRGFAVDETGHADRHTRLCRWDQSEGLLPDGTISTHAGPIHLENGVKVVFSPADGQPQSVFRTGDYWLFAARPGNTEFETLDQAPPRGIHHHLCRLAVIEVAEDHEVQVIDDCRPQKTECKASCCVVTVGDGIHSQGDFTNDIQGAVDAVSSGGKVCVLEGTFGLSESIQINTANVSLMGCGHQTRIQPVSRFAQGFSLISIQANDVTISNLSLGRLVSITPNAEHLPPPLLRAEHADGLEIFGCSLHSGNNAAAIGLALCVDVNIKNCEIHGYPALLASQCIDVRVDNNRVSEGGLWIGTGSQSIFITRNRIADGKGPGILLGDGSEEPNPIHTPALMFVVKSRGAAFTDSTRRARLLTKDNLTDGILSEVVAIAVPGNIQRVQIKENIIEGMGGSGIATLYQKTLEKPDDIAALDSVEDLEITGNQILHCVQEEPDCSFPDHSGFGAGILLAGASNVRIRQNEIAWNGCETDTDEELWPACGILAGDCEEIEISDNHCVDNGRSSEDTDRKYLQAELALLYVNVKPETLSRDAARVHNNVVRCKAGQAILAMTVGNLSIVGNTFESLGYRSQPLLIRENNLPQGLEFSLECITRFSCLLLLQYPVEATPPVTRPCLLTLNDNRIVAYAGSHVVASATGSDVPPVYGSTGIWSEKGDVSISSNQFSYIVPINTHKNDYFLNVKVFGGEVRAVGNYFGGEYKDASYCSCAQGFNIATSNMAMSLFVQNWNETCTGLSVCLDNNLP